MCRALLALLAACAGLHADDAADLAQAAKSPYELARFLDAHPKLELGVAGKILDTPWPIFPAQSTELIKNPKPEQVILLVHSVGDIYVRYLRSGTGWKSTGVFRSWNKYYPSQHSIIQFGAKPFLRVTAPGSSGSGLGSDMEAWLDLTAPKFEPVFYYSPSGSYDGWPEGTPGHEWRGRIESFAARPVETIRVAYTATFHVRLHGTERRIGTRKDTLVYLRSSGSEFKLDPKHSTIPQEDIDSLYEEVGFDSGEDILRWDLRSLRGIASGPASPEKKWLVEFLSKCKPTAERRELEALLAK